MSHPNLADILEDKLRNELIQRLGPDAEELRSEHIHSIILAYRNWRQRFVAQRSRVAHMSPELTASDKLIEHKAAIDAIIAKIEAGADLTAHLSTRTQTPYLTKANRAERKHYGVREDLDVLLADWSIHHLHLDTTIKPNGFTGRTQDLLFAVFRDDDAYLAGIYGHGTWAPQDVAETIHRNWPHLQIFLTLPGFSLAQQHTDEERKQMRNAGLLNVLEIDGQAVVPIGINTAGTSSMLVREIDGSLRDLQLLRTDPEAFFQKIHELLPDVTITGRWFAHIEPESYGVRNGDEYVTIGFLN